MLYDYMEYSMIRSNTKCNTLDAGNPEHFLGRTSELRNVGESLFCGTLSFLLQRPPPAPRPRREAARQEMYFGLHAGWVKLSAG